MTEETRRLTLIKLLERSRIEIPRLQRDYAQGRKSQEKIARGFLSSIFNVLNNKNDTSLHIDFIYGYQKEENFILVDGQQRITTLWLLYILLYRYANRLGEVQKILLNFSYSVRESSSDFCENLLRKDFDLNIKPSVAIKDMGGEFCDAEDLYNDPTIKSMINMLDLIYEFLSSVKDINLLILKLNNITFDIFNMNDFNLGEELYIKMNARGKQLSKYENLKAFIEKSNEVSKNDEIVLRIDTAWSDYFFDSRHFKKFDTRGRNFLHYATLFFTLVDKQFEIDNFSQKLNHPDLPIDEDFYSPLQRITNIQILDRVISICTLYREEKLLKLADSSFFDEDKMAYVHLCYFFSILAYAQKLELVSKDLKQNLVDYLRVSRHFIENHALDSEKDIISFLKLFIHLSEHIDQNKMSIYHYLVENPSYPFNNKIYILEVKKAKLILKDRQTSQDNGWEKILNNTSDHDRLIGWIDFLLDFSDKNFDNKVFGSPNDCPDFDKFSQYAKLTMDILDRQFLDANLQLFQRALLCMGNYGFESINFFYGTSSITGYRDREAWNWLLSGIKNPTKKPFFKTLLDKLITLSDLPLQQKLETIIKECKIQDKQWWEQLMIGSPEMFAFLSKKRDGFQRTQRVRFHKNAINPEKVELLPNKRNKKGVHDLFDYAFYSFCKKKSTTDISEYECDEEQYGFSEKNGIESHFKINNKKIICHSKDKTITFGDYKYQVDFKNNLFDEFERIWISIKEILQDR